MAFCKQCGKQIPDNANACPYCGTMVAPQAPQQAAPQQNYQQAPQQGYQQAPQQGYGYAPQPGYAQQPYVSPEMDIQQSRGIAWLSYLELLFLVPMFVRKYSDYTRFHVKQGATLFAFELAYSLTYWILMAIFGAIFPPVYHYVGYYYSYYTTNPGYTIFAILFGSVFVFFGVLTVMGIINAATGKKRELFLIGKIPWIAKLLDVTVYK